MYDNRHLFPDGARAYRTYYFNTHFISKLNVGSDNYSYKEVQRWTSSKQNPICTSSGELPECGAAPVHIVLQAQLQNTMCCSTQCTVVQKVLLLNYAVLVHVGLVAMCTVGC